MVNVDWCHECNNPIGGCKCAPYGVKKDARQEHLASTVAVGIVPGRTDGMLSLHVGNAVVYLDRADCGRLAADLETKVGESYALTRPKPKGEAEPTFHRRLGSSAQAICRVGDERTGPKDRRVSRFGYRMVGPHAKSRHNDGRRSTDATAPPVESTDAQRPKARVSTDTTERRKSLSSNFWPERRKYTRRLNNRSGGSPNG